MHVAWQKVLLFSSRKESRQKGSRVLAEKGWRNINGLWGPIYNMADVDRVRQHVLTIETSLSHNTHKILFSIKLF